MIKNIGLNLLNQKRIASMSKGGKFLLQTALLGCGIFAVTQLTKKHHVTSPERVKTHSDKLLVIPYTSNAAEIEADPYAYTDFYDLHQKQENYVTKPKHLIAKNLYINNDGKIDMNQFSEEYFKTIYNDDRYDISAYGVTEFGNGDYKRINEVYRLDNCILYSEFDYVNGKEIETEYEISNEGDLQEVITRECGDVISYRTYKNNLLIQQGKDRSDCDYVAYYNLIKELDFNYIDAVNVSKIKTDIYQRITSAKDMVCAFQDFDIITKIKESKALPDSEKEKIIKYLSDLMYDSNRNVENSRIENPYYTSNTAYNARFEDNRIHIEESDVTWHSENIYLKSLLYEDNNEFEKIRLKHLLQQMPPEALMDLAIEINTLKIQYINSTHGESGHFKYIDDGHGYKKEEVSVTQNIEAILHELGHAIDRQEINGEMTFCSDANPEFQAAFETGMKRYRKAGFTQYSYEAGYKSVEKQKFDELSDDEQRELGFKYDSNYCTCSVEEMMAECYTLLMLGKCKTQNVILKYFPECLEETRKIVENTRKLPKAKRAINY